MRPLRLLMRARARGQRRGESEGSNLLCSCFDQSVCRRLQCVPRSQDIIDEPNFPRACQVLSNAKCATDVLPPGLADQARLGSCGSNPLEERRTPGATESLGEITGDQIRMIKPAPNPATRVQRDGKDQVRPRMGFLPDLGRKRLSEEARRVLHIDRGTKSASGVFERGDPEPDRAFIAEGRTG